MVEVYDKLGTKYFARRELVDGGDIDIVEHHHIRDYEGESRVATKSLLANTLFMNCYDSERQLQTAGDPTWFDLIPAVARKRVVRAHHPDDEVYLSPIVGIEVVTFIELPQRLLDRQLIIPQLGAKSLDLLFRYSDDLRAEYEQFAE